MTITGGGAYVWWQVTRPGSALVRSVLARVDVATGKILARTRLNATISQVLETSGWLWVASYDGVYPMTVTVLKLDPATLTVTRRSRLGTSGMPPRSALAVAGGGLWVTAGDRLLRLSLPAGVLTGSVTLPGAASSTVSADAAGTMLVVGMADRSGRGAVQRRDPVTGALLASHPVDGVTAPVVAGPIASAIWVVEPTGMMGYVQRLSAATMTAGERNCELTGPTNTCLVGTNGITARIADGLLWITQVDGGSRLNYCADPADGHRLAALGLPRPAEDMVLAIGPHQIFYAAPGPKAGQYLRQMAIPSACRTR